MVPKCIGGCDRERAPKRLYCVPCTEAFEQQQQLHRKQLRQLAAFKYAGGLHVDTYGVDCFESEDEPCALTTTAGKTHLKIGDVTSG